MLRERARDLDAVLARGLATCGPEAGAPHAAAHQAAAPSDGHLDREHLDGLERVSAWVPASERDLAAAAKLAAVTGGVVLWGRVCTARARASKRRFAIWAYGFGPAPSGLTAPGRAS